MKRTAFAINTPPEANGIEFRKFSNSGVEWIVPHTDGQPHCPVCGCGPDTEDVYQDLEWDLCPVCKFAWGEDALPYNDSVDSEFGGQFGMYRKEWLNQSGWQKTDLQQIEHVFQISTQDWPRE